MAKRTHSYRVDYAHSVRQVTNAITPVCVAAGDHPVIETPLGGSPRWLTYRAVNWHARTGLRRVVAGGIDGAELWERS